jgi:hypothetical protein
MTGGAKVDAVRLKDIYLILWGGLRRMAETNPYNFLFNSQKFWQTMGFFGKADLAEELGL